MFEIVAKHISSMLVQTFQPFLQPVHADRLLTQFNLQLMQTPPSRTLAASKKAPISFTTLAITGTARSRGSTAGRAEIMAEVMLRSGRATGRARVL